MQADKSLTCCVFVRTSFYFKSIPGIVAEMSSIKHFVFSFQTTGHLVTWNLNGSWFD